MLIEIALLLIKYICTILVIANGIEIVLIIKLSKIKFALRDIVKKNINVIFILDGIKYG